MLKNSVFYYVHSHLANLFSVAVPLLKTKHLLGYGIWGGFPTESTFTLAQKLPATPKRGCFLSNRSSLMLNPSVSVKWTMCKQPWAWSKLSYPNSKKALCFTGYLSRGNLWFNCLTIQGEMTFDHGTYALEKPAERLFLEHFYRSNATLSGSFKKKQKRM